MKEGISGKLLSGVQAAESSLARQEYEELEASLPEGHPLREQIDRFKAEMGGDLSGLPERHPLILQMKAAKERYETEQIAEETDEAQEKHREIKKAKKIDRQKARREQIVKEEDQSKKSKIAASDVNREITKVLDAIKSLYGVLAAHEEILNINPLSKARTLRLKRMLTAVEHGVSDSRMGRV